MGYSVVRVRMLERATGIVGGVEPMAAMLQVTVHQLEQWLRGEKSIPPEVFFRALEVVNEGHAGAARPERRPTR
jgi:DNA-binding transcriptional regulator YdaS (Cro superfamily)